MHLKHNCDDVLDWMSHAMGADASWKKKIQCFTFVFVLSNKFLSLLVSRHNTFYILLNFPCVILSYLISPLFLFPRSVLEVFRIVPKTI